MLDILAIVFAVSFASSFVVIPRFMEFLREANILGIDQQKPGKPLLPSSGGIPVAFGVMAGMMVYIALNTFILKAPLDLTSMLAASSTILIITLVGVMDDLNIRQTQTVARTGTSEYRLGLRQWVKPVLSLLGAIPLIVVSSGTSYFVVPFLGEIDVGIIYPLLIVPIGVVVVSNVNNMLAGMNGLEAGMGFVASAGLGTYLLMFGRMEASVIAFALAAALLAFLRYNKYPAKILPGDSLTYLIGATFVTAVIIGNVERFAMFIYLPWIAEALLKLRGKFAVSSLGVLQEDGRLKSRYGKVYSLTHLFLRTGKFTEKQITLAMMGIEAILVVVGIVIFAQPA